jgi:hypothetical protein
LSVSFDGVALLVQALVELVEGDAVLDGVEGSLVRRAVVGYDPVGQTPLQDTQIPADVAEPEDELDRGRHDHYGILRPRAESQGDAPGLLGLVVGFVEVHLDHPVPDWHPLAAQPVTGPPQRTGFYGGRGPARNVLVRGELHHPGGQETLDLVRVPVVHAHDATLGEDGLVEVLEERGHVQRLALRVLGVQARNGRRVEGVTLVGLPHLEDGGTLLPEGHHAALVEAVAPKPVQLLGLALAPSGLLEDLLSGGRLGGRRDLPGRLEKGGQGIVRRVLRQPRPALHGRRSLALREGVLNPGVDPGHAEGLVGQPPDVVPLLTGQARGGEHGPQPAHYAV